MFNLYVRHFLLAHLHIHPGTRNRLHLTNGKRVENFSFWWLSGVVFGIAFYDAIILNAIVILALSGV